MASGQSWMVKILFALLCTSLTAGQHWSTPEQIRQVTSVYATFSCGNQPWCTCFPTYPLTCQWEWLTYLQTIVIFNYSKELRNARSRICQNKQISNSVIRDFADALKAFKKEQDRLTNVNGEVEVIVINQDEEEKWKNGTVFYGTRTMVDAEVKTLYQIFDCPCPGFLCKWNWLDRS